jgi:hypothetical protein
MESFEADKMVKEWHARHPKEELCAPRADNGELYMTFVGTRAMERVQKYSVEQAKKAMADAELENGYTKFRHVLDKLHGQSTNVVETEFDWLNGDVLDVGGRFGIFSRCDEDEYVDFSIPKVYFGRVFWLWALPTVTGAMKVGDAEAEEWAREYEKGALNGFMPMGLRMWRRRFEAEKATETEALADLF